MNQSLQVSLVKQYLHARVRALSASLSAYDCERKVEARKQYRYYPEAYGFEKYFEDQFITHRTFTEDYQLKLDEYKEKHAEWEAYKEDAELYREEALEWAQEATRIQPRVLYVFYKSELEKHISRYLKLVQERKLTKLEVDTYDICKKLEKLLQYEKHFFSYRNVA